MSDVNDRYVIDRMVIEDGKLVLILADSMQWGACHLGLVIQHKIN